VGEPEVWGYYNRPEVVPEIICDVELDGGRRRLYFVLYPTDETPADSLWTVRVLCSLGPGQRDPRSAVDQLATLARSVELDDVLANPEVEIVDDLIMHVDHGKHCAVTYSPPATFPMAGIVVTLHAVMEDL